MKPGSPPPQARNASLLVVGFSLGFHDAVHHLPVVRQAAIASTCGIRFQGHGYGTHRGTGGAAGVISDPRFPTPAMRCWLPVSAWR